MSKSITGQVAPPLPADIDDWVRAIKSERSLNDLVEDVHRVLVNESEQYREYLRATYDAHAVEGSLSADNTLAAQMLRERAKTMSEYEEVAKQKLAIINSCLNVVMRRYKASRKQRRKTVGGREVNDDNGNDE